MPTLRCTDDDCGHSWPERSELAVGADCEVCGAPTVVVGVDDDGPPGLESVPALDRAHPGYARQKAREIAREHRLVQPPVVVHKIARDLGFEVKKSHNLGGLSARLAGKVIEVNAEEPSVRHRFSVAHELGHHFLGTRHGGGKVAEQEANAFAGELLVPGPMLKTAMESTTDATELRKMFAVSRNVLRIAAEHHKLDKRLTGQ